MGKIVPRLSQFAFCNLPCSFHYAFTILRCAYFNTIAWHSNISELFCSNSSHHIIHFKTKTVTIYKTCHESHKESNHLRDTGMEIFTPMKTQVVVWNLTTYSDVVRYHRFGGLCCLHLQGEVKGVLERGHRYRQGI
jgi:hypothetical protein